ncbi:hypothetical protein VSU19_22450 [Verrucomicrobiales bacterium BCK34]|nr:hypothetical protein [Verrucomicrobiales bacterium BCK34]
MKDDNLQRRLEEWEIDVPDDPHFRASVWREISIREKSPTMDWLREVIDRMVNPRLAAPLAIGAVIVVLASASLHGVQSREKAWERMALAYSSSIDPVAHTEHELAKQR